MPVLLVAKIEGSTLMSKKEFLSNYVHFRIFCSLIFSFSSALLRDPNPCINPLILDFSVNKSFYNLLRVFSISSTFYLISSTSFFGT